MADVDKRGEGWLFAEDAVIGSLLIDEKAALAILAAVDAGDIQREKNRQIYQAARALTLAGLPVDPVLIRDKLGQGIEGHILQLMEVTPTSANWREYAEVMHQQAALARIRDIAAELTSCVSVDECREHIAALGQVLDTGKGVDAWSMREAMEYFMAAQADQAEADYISYGIRELDEGTYTEKGDVVVIGGEPSSGKTALALAMAYHMAKERNVGFFSLETGKKKLTQRLATTVIGLDFNAVKRKQLQEADWQRIANDSGEVISRSLTLIQGSGMTASQIQSVSRSYGFDVIFIDYVQMVTPEGDPRAGSAQAFAGVSRALHTFAQSSGTLVVELAQLARPQKQGGWKEPNMHDLKETGQLEQDADIIMLLYKPKPGTEIYGAPCDVNRTRFLKIDKQKEGRLGRWPLHFDGVHQRFAIMAGPDGRTAMQKYVDAGRAAKQRPREQSPGQIGIHELAEDDPNVPWGKEE